MGSDKSILEKIADTVRDIVRIASDAADHRAGARTTAGRQAAWTR